MRLQALTGWSHLVKRFFGALDPAGPSPADEAWAESILGPGSGAHRLWTQMSGPDRRHAIGVARRAALAAGTEGTPDLMAAALLHDVGKIAAGLGTLARVPVTLIGAAGGRARAERWAEAAGGRGPRRNGEQQRIGVRTRTGTYLRHPEVGSQLLREAGAPELAAAWALEHHRPPDRWTVPADTARILKDADDD